ncbi:MAG: manganese efflux pump MntP family protein [Streptosporangiaceae bacterium]
MLALLLLAAALGLDNLAAAIGIGVGGVRGATRVRVAVVFGLFEAGMPVLGLLLGHGLADSLGEVARWLGGAVLIAVGLVQGAGLVRARHAAAPAGGAPEAGALAPGGRARPQRIGRQPIWRQLLGGLVLSGDNLAAGFALGAYHASLALAAAVFGVVSVAMSLAGLELGARIGAVTGDRSELIACALLIATGAVIASGAL